MEIKIICQCVYLVLFVMGCMTGISQVVDGRSSTDPGDSTDVCIYIFITIILILVVFGTGAFSEIF